MPHGASLGTDSAGSAGALLVHQCDHQDGHRHGHRDPHTACLDPVKRWAVVAEDRNR